MDIQKLLDDFNSALSEPVYDKIELPPLMLAEYNEAVSEKKTKRSYYLDLSSICIVICFRKLKIEMMNILSYYIYLNSKWQNTLG